MLIFFALSHPYMAKEVATLLVQEIVKLHGFPTSIISGRDKLFMNTFWTELFKEAGTKLKMTSAYHPQTDRQSEAINKCVETYLKCFSGYKPRQWPRRLPWFYKNITIQRSIWKGSSFTIERRRCNYGINLGPDTGKKFHVG